MSRIAVPSRLAELAPLPLRLIVGYGFLAHGLAKIDKGPEHFVAIFHALGVPFPAIMAWLTIAVEVGCGLLMLAGALVPAITLPMLAVLFVALVTVHAQFGFTSIKLMAMTATGRSSGRPGWKPTYSTWPVSQRWCSADRVHLPSIIADSQMAAALACA